MNPNDQQIINKNQIVSDKDKEFLNGEDFIGKLRDKIRELNRQSEIYLNHAPAKIKYNLAQYIRTSTLDLTRLTIKAQKIQTKKTTLIALDTELEILREQWLIFFENGYFSYKREHKDQDVDAVHHYAVIQKMTAQIGNMIGGWRKHDFERNSSQYTVKNV